MSSRSFEQINYLLRPNKNVERKLIAKTLLHLQRGFPIDDYRYVGFGSMWFGDFTLMHKVVGISDLVTIEAVLSRRKRVEFNRPYRCVHVAMGMAADVLVDHLLDKPTVTWLDYDGPLADALSGDVEIAVGAMRPGSLLLASVNANADQLSHRLKEDRPLTPMEYLVAISDDAGLARRPEMLARNRFPALALDILHDRLTSAVLEGKPGCRYAPIWTFSYADQVEMVTAGGMIVDEVQAVTLEECGLSALDYASGRTPFRIQLPMLTEREKRELDRRLPQAAALDPAELPFELKPSELEDYRRFYREYPIFSEVGA